MAYDLLRSAKHIQGLSNGEFRVLFFLLESANADTYECFPRIKTIAKYTEMEERTVQRHISALADKGLFKRVQQRREDGSRAATLYRFEASGHMKIGREIVVVLGAQKRDDDGDGFLPFEDEKAAPIKEEGNPPILTPPPVRIDTPPRQNWRDINRESEPGIRTNTTPIGVVGDLAQKPNSETFALVKSDDTPAGVLAYVKAEWAKLKEELGDDIADLRGIRPAQERAIVSLAESHRRSNESLVAVWEQIFANIRGSRFLSGKVPPGPGKAHSFRLSLSTALKPHLFQEILNGKYTDKQSNAALIDDRTGLRVGPAKQAGSNALQRLRAARQRGGRDDHS